MSQREPCSASCCNPVSSGLISLSGHGADVTGPRYPVFGDDVTTQWGLIRGLAVVVIGRELLYCDWLPGRGHVTPSCLVDGSIHE